ncbi:hypothetical protein N0V82_005841 [Gnomoniopsis sp. IMI 355080]|nr:hypothetical protein N0V82_005841 [Gnomoniopsis sp. IMI 355080]
MFKLASATAFAATLALTRADTVGFGPYFSLGPVADGSFIRAANTTLVLPAVQSQHKSFLSLWPGMSTSNGDLIQAYTDSLADPQTECGGEIGQWCTVASTYSGTQNGGTMAPVSEGDHLLISYVYNDATSQYDQTVTVDGEVVSKFSSTSGYAQGWGTACECQEEGCDGSVNAHKYLSTTIVLDKADSAFGDTLSLNEATSSGLASSDGGVTWSVDTISINAYTYNL